MPSQKIIVEMWRHTCAHCGRVWESKVMSVMCPKCKRRDWHEPTPELAQAPTPAPTPTPASALAKPNTGTDDDVFAVKQKNVFDSILCT